MFRENLLNFMNYFLQQTWFFALIGIVSAAVLERGVILASLKKKQKGRIKRLWPFFRRLLYVIGGYVLILSSFALVNMAINFFLVPPATPAVVPELVPAGGFLMFLKYQSQYAGLVGVMMLIMAGVSLMLSAGSRWLVTLAKLIVTVTAFYLIVSGMALIG